MNLYASLLPQRSRRPEGALPKDLEDYLRYARAERWAQRDPKSYQQWKEGQEDEDEEV